MRIIQARVEVAVEREHTHLFIGKETDVGPKTKTGCGLLATDCKKGGYSYANLRGDLNKISCPKCKTKAEDIQRMRQKASLAFSPDSSGGGGGGSGGDGGPDDGGVERAKAVARQMGLKTEQQEEALMVYFPATKYSYVPAKDGKPGAPTDPKKTAIVVPLLMTTDGILWTPDFDFHGEPGWAGAIDLRGKRLLGEIQAMVTRCQLGDSTRVKMFAYLDALK